MNKHAPDSDATDSNGNASERIRRNLFERIDMYKETLRTRRDLDEAHVKDLLYLLVQQVWDLAVWHVGPSEAKRMFSWWIRPQAPNERKFDIMYELFRGYNEAPRGEKRAFLLHQAKMNKRLPRCDQKGAGATTVKQLESYIHDNRNKFRKWQEKAERECREEKRRQVEKKLADEQRRKRLNAYLRKIGFFDRCAEQE